MPPRKPPKSSKKNPNMRPLTSAERRRFWESVHKGKLPVPSSGKPTPAQLEQTRFQKLLERIVKRGISERRTHGHFKGRHRRPQ